MTVAELIELLKTCDPKARVVVREEPLIMDDHDAMDGAMQDVEALEPGWTSKDIQSDLTFSLYPIGEFLEPAIRIMGVNDEPTRTHPDSTINGVKPMMDVTPPSIKRLPKPS